MSRFILCLIGCFYVCCMKGYSKIDNELKNSYDNMDIFECSKDYYDGCPKECNTLRTSFSGRKYCDCDEIDYCQESDSCDNSGIYNNNNNNRHNSRNTGGCDECQDGYFKRDYSTNCVSCLEIFHDSCNVCSDFHGCLECAEGFIRVEDEYCGKKNKKFYYCQPETCINKEYIENTIDITPSWLYGRNAIGSRHVGISENELLQGNTAIVNRKTQRYSAPCDYIWSIFNDFLTIENKISMELYGTNASIYEMVEDINGSAINSNNSSIGEIVSYLAEIAGVWIEFYEELTIKDNNNYIWEINGVSNNYSGNNSINMVFENYIFIIQLFNDVEINPITKGIISNQACMAVIDLEYQFKNNIPSQVRKVIINEFKEKLDILSLFFWEETLNTRGYTVQGTSPLNAPLEFVFDYFEDWTQIEWILPAVQDSLTLLQNDIRYYWMYDYEYIVQARKAKGELNDNNAIVVNEVLKSVGLYYALRDTIKLTKISQNVTQLNGFITWIVKDESYLDVLIPLFEAVVDGAITYWPAIIENAYNNAA